MSDKDVQALMQNLRDDAKSFKPQFNSAISKSTIRKTSREKERQKSGRPVPEANRSDAE